MTNVISHEKVAWHSIWYPPSNNNISSIGLVLESFQNSQGNLCLLVSIQLNLKIKFKVEAMTLVKLMHDNYFIHFTNFKCHGKVSQAMRTACVSSLHNANNKQERHQAQQGHKKKQSTCCMDNNSYLSYSSVTGTLKQNVNRPWSTRTNTVNNKFVTTINTLVQFK